MSARKNMAGTRGTRAVLGLLAAFLFVVLAGCLSPKPAYAGDSGGAATGDEQVTINIKVMWEDPYNMGIAPPESVNVVVRSTEEPIRGLFITEDEAAQSVEVTRAEVSAATNWEASFTLPFWKEGGEGQSRVPANYYVEHEDFVWGNSEDLYVTNYTKNDGRETHYMRAQIIDLEDPAVDSVQSVTICSTYYGGDRVLLNFRVEWEDEGFENQRPSSVTVRLLGNGAEVDSFTLSEENNWAGSCRPLIYDSEKQEINYEFIESDIDGYEISYSDNNGGKPNSPDDKTYEITLTSANNYFLTIHNARKAPEPEPEPAPDPEPAPEPDAPAPEAPAPEAPKPSPAPEPEKSVVANPKVPLVQTGDAASSAVPALVAVVAVSAIVAGVAKRKSMGS